MLCSRDKVQRKACTLIPLSKLLFVQLFVMYEGVKDRQKNGMQLFSLLAQGIRYKHIASDQKYTAERAAQNWNGVWDS